MSLDRQLLITHQRLKAGAGVFLIVNKDLTDVESAGRPLAGRQISILSKQIERKTIDWFDKA